MTTPRRWSAARARMAMYASLRRYFDDAGYLEVETPCLVPAAGMEPHIDPFEVEFVPQTGVGVRRTMYLQTSPEYAMKRLLASGSPPIFQICKTFRNGEISKSHNPEFTMLEFYRPNADYMSVMADLEQALSRVEKTIAPSSRSFSHLPWERLTVRDAMLRYANIDVFEHDDGPKLRRAAEAAGIHVGTSTEFDDVFFHIFLERVESKLGWDRPTFLIEYPASMASLARLKASDTRVAERVELYVRGVELANGFSELTDAAEQRQRLLDEQALRLRQGRMVPPIDEAFLEAVGRMPPSGGIAVGLDRVLMLLLGVEEIRDVLLVPE